MPKLKYFKKEFDSLEDNNDYYPILSYLLDKNSNIQYLKYLPIINNFCNNMITSCSYRYTRDEAKRLKIKEELRFSEDLGEKEKFND